MAAELNFWKRLKGETPKFFKRVIALALTLAAAGAAVLTAPQLVNGFELDANIIKYAQWAVVGGIVAAAVGQSTIQK